MFEWIKNTFFESEQEMLKNYLNKIDEMFYKNSSETIINCRQETFEKIYSMLIGQAKNSIYVVCKDYDFIFSEKLFPLFSLIVKKEIDITVISYGGKIDERLKDLTCFENFNYFVCKVSNENELNDFIVSDLKMIWIKDVCPVLKAQVCFNDLINSSCMIGKWKKYEKNMTKIKKTT